MNQTRPSLIELFQVRGKTGQCDAFLNALLHTYIQCYQNDPIADDDDHFKDSFHNFVANTRGNGGSKRENSHGDSHLLSLFSGLHMTTAMLMPPQSVSYHVVVVFVMNDRGNSIAPNLCFPLRLP